MDKKLEKINLLYQEFECIKSFLNEKERRLWAARQAQNIGRGGIVLVCRATGMSNSTIHKGLRELAHHALPSHRIRQKGGGRRKMEIGHAQEALISLMKPDYTSLQTSPFLWTLHNTLILSKRAKMKGLNISSTTVAEILHQSHFFLRSSKLTPRYPSVKTRDAQCRRISVMAQRCAEDDQPLIFLDLRENPTAPYNELPSISSPPGLWPCEWGDITRNKGWHSVDLQPHHIPFVLSCLLSCLPQALPSFASPEKICLVIRGYIKNQDPWLYQEPWHQGLQHLAHTLRLPIRVRHLPPSTFRWNHISEHTTTYSLIHKTLTALNLSTIGQTNQPPTLASYWNTPHHTALPSSPIFLKRDKFHPEWNYEVRP